MLSLRYHPEHPPLEFSRDHSIVRHSALLRELNTPSEDGRGAEGPADDDGTLDLFVRLDASRDSEDPTRETVAFPPNLPDKLAVFLAWVAGETDDDAFLEAGIATEPPAPGSKCDRERRGIVFLGDCLDVGRALLLDEPLLKRLRRLVGKLTDDVPPETVEEWTVSITWEEFMTKRKWSTEAPAGYERRRREEWRMAEERGAAGGGGGAGAAGGPD